MPKIAQVGCGLWGQKILHELVILGQSVDIYDLNPMREAAALKIGAAAFYEHWTGLAEYDGVILATPSSTHRHLLEQILPFAIPVFVEKPLTTSLQDALALERYRTDKLFMMHTWIYHPAILMLGEIARSGELGALLGLRSTRGNWTSPRKDTDTVWNLAPHDLTIAKIIMGGIPEPRCAVAERHDGKIRSFTAILGKSPSFVFEVSNRYEQKIREVRANFERGIAVFESDELGAIKILHGDAQSEIEDVQVEYRRYPDVTALRLELQEFVSHLGGGPAPRSSFQDGLEIVKTIDKLIELAGE
ncbi:Gfo/Idh/MocA family protein [Aestuariivirga sp.]|jgi:predicted dehydrogenase|uniref:Gfo/Idh/MocA family protein n=1 Tax=Aestuariivirga sp. TaxID=2650926 RepID=UPI0037847F08